MYSNKGYNSNKVDLYKTLRKSKIPDRMRAFWEVKFFDYYFLLYLNFNS